VSEFSNRSKSNDTRYAKKYSVYCQWVRRSVYFQLYSHHSWTYYQYRDRLKDVYSWPKQISQLWWILAFKQQTRLKERRLDSELPYGQWYQRVYYYIWHRKTRQRKVNQKSWIYSGQIKTESRALERPWKRDYIGRWRWICYFLVVLRRHTIVCDICAFRSNYSNAVQRRHLTIDHV